MPKDVKISLYDYVNNHVMLKAGKVEELAAFLHYMENIVKKTRETEKNFSNALEEFRKKEL